jgi:predicted phage terminase large subunit-like protein
MKLNLSLLPWQLEVMAEPERFKVIGAGRRTGKSHLAAVTLVLAALDDKPGKVFYVAPTQGMARDIMWDKLYEIAGDVIESHNINNLTLTLTNGATIYLKGADRPDTLRGVSLKHLVLDEYAFMKPDVFDSILRPTLSDRKGTCIFIGTPEGRNHFYDLYERAKSGTDEGWGAWHYTSYDNPTMDKEEVDHARATLPNWAFQQEYMASFSAQGSEHFDVDHFNYYDKLDKTIPGDFFIAVDLAGFEEKKGSKTAKRDNSAIACVYVTDDGDWHVEDIIYGRWTLAETAEKIFAAVEKYRPQSIGIEKGLAQQAVMQPLQDLMRRTSRVFRIEMLSHGNTKKTDRILWALAGRFENGYINLKQDKRWNLAFIDEASNFPSTLVHDDLIDALSYVDQMVTIPYRSEMDFDTDWEPLDAISGY